MKQIALSINHWVIIAIVTFCATFADDGLNITITGYEWITSVSNILSNFVVVYYVIMFIGMVLLLITSIAYDEFFKQSAESMLKKNDVTTALHKIRFRTVSFVCITIPLWTLLIAAGWFFVFAVNIFTIAVIQYIRYQAQQYIIKHHVTP